jgi:hypothetical protein
LLPTDSRPASLRLRSAFEISAFYPRFHGLIRRDRRVFVSASRMTVRATPQGRSVV